jgi:hypothetical protein
LIQVERLMLFLYHNVQVGCPHLFDSLKIFWYHGRLIEVNDDDIVLKIGDSLRVIPIKHILTIELDRRSQ